MKGKLYLVGSDLEHVGVDRDGIRLVEGHQQDAISDLRKENIPMKVHLMLRQLMFHKDPSDVDKILDGRWVAFCRLFICSCKPKCNRLCPGHLKAAGAPEFHPFFLNWEERVAEGSTKKYENQKRSNVTPFQVLFSAFPS